MPTLKRILVPTDLSELSQVALEEAAMVARLSDAEVTLLHVWTPPAYGAAAFVIDPTVDANMVEELERGDLGSTMAAWASVLRDLGVAEVRSRIEIGAPAELILRTAKVGEYDLVVMATHGRKGLAHLALGSVAEEIVRRSPCAVLTVRARPTPPAREKEHRSERDAGYRGLPDYPLDSPSSGA